MIALLLAIQAIAADPLPGPIGRQTLPARGCAAYLWSRGPTPQLVAMATADPATLRLAIGGEPADLPRTAQTGGDAGFGFTSRTDYTLADGVATLEMTVVPRPDLAGGAVVSDATLTIARTGADAVLLPVGGLIGCAATR